MQVTILKIRRGMLINIFMHFIDMIIYMWPQGVFNSMYLTIAAVVISFELSFSSMVVPMCSLIMIPV